MFGYKIGSQWEVVLKTNIADGLLRLEKFK